MASLRTMLLWLKFIAWGHVLCLPSKPWQWDISLNILCLHYLIMKKMTDEKRDRRSWYQLKFLEELSDVFTFDMLHVPRFWTSSFLNTDYNVERDCAVIYMLVKGEFNILQMLPSSWMRYCIYQFLPISHVPSYLSLLPLTIIPDFYLQLPPFYFISFQWRFKNIYSHL